MSKHITIEHDNYSRARGHARTPNQKEKLNGRKIRPMLDQTSFDRFTFDRFSVPYVVNTQLIDSGPSIKCVGNQTSYDKSLYVKQRSVLGLKYTGHVSPLRTSVP